MFIGLCLLWKGFHTFSIVFFFPHLLFFRMLHVALCGVFAVLRVAEANNNVRNKPFIFLLHIVDSIMLLTAISAFTLKATHNGKYYKLNLHKTTFID